MQRVIYVVAEGMRVRAAGVAGRPAAAAADGRVVDRCRRAAAAGVEPGMRVRQARRVCPALRVVSVADDERNLLALSETLYRALYELAPLVEPDGPAAAFAAVRLSRRYGEEDLLADLRAFAGRVCPHAADTLTVGVAESRFVARLAAVQARSGGGKAAPPAGGEGWAVSTAGGRLRMHAVPAGESAAWLAPLPVEALWPLSSAVQRRLAGLGLRTLGDVARANPRALAAELGAEGVRAGELARGIDRSGVTPGYPPREVEAVFRPEGGLDGAGQIERAAVEAACRLAGRLVLRAEGTRRLWLLLDGEIPVSAVREFSAPAARLDTLREAARALAREAAALASRDGRGQAAAFAGLRLVARDLAALPVRQEALWPEAPAAEERRGQVARLLADLRRRFPAHVVRSGQQVAVPRRERMLALWDPYRFARGLWEPS